MLYVIYQIDTSTGSEAVDYIHRDLEHVREVKRKCYPSFQYRDVFGDLHNIITKIAKLTFEEVK